MSSIYPPRVITWGRGRGGRRCGGGDGGGGDGGGFVDQTLISNLGSIKVPLDESSELSVSPRALLARVNESITI